MRRDIKLKIVQLEKEEQKIVTKEIHAILGENEPQPFTLISTQTFPDHNTNCQSHGNQTNLPSLPNNSSFKDNEQLDYQQRILELEVFYS